MTKEPESRGVPPINDVVMFRLLSIPIVCYHMALTWAHVVVARCHLEHATTLQEMFAYDTCARGHCKRLRESLSE